jgi:glycosyltransferase involved in cell wall biosynthesis
MLEAWAAGTALVAAASQGPAAFIADGTNGLLVPVNDAPALAAAIRRLLEESGLNARLIAQGRADYHNGFTQEAVTRRMIALYSEIVAEHSGAGGAATEERA